MTKREKLTKSELQSLQEFVGKCVMENVAFPPIQMGGANATIQDIMHNRSVDSLGKYNDFLESQASRVSRIDKINGKDSDKKIGTSSVSYTDAVSQIDLIIKNKLYIEYKEKMSERLKEINKELEMIETPAEKKSKLLKEKKALMA